MVVVPAATPVAVSPPLALPPPPGGNPPPPPVVAATVATAVFDELQVTPDWREAVVPFSYTAVTV